MADPRAPGPGLPPDERADARFDDEVRTAYRRGAHPDAAETAARARVLARLAAAPARTRGFRWWFTRQPIALRPAWALAALAAALVAGAGIGSRFAPAPEARRTAPPAPDTRAATVLGKTVTFVLRAPGATRVNVVGDFNNWDAEATPMVHSGSGDLWVLNIVLERGVHHYSFVLDGTEWRPDPSAPLAADDPFGGHNSVIVVNGARGL